MQHVNYNAVRAISINLRQTGLSNEDLDLIDVGGATLSAHGRTLIFSWQASSASLEDDGSITIDYEWCDKAESEACFDTTFDLLTSDLTSDELSVSIGIACPEDHVKLTYVSGYIEILIEDDWVKLPFTEADVEEKNQPERPAFFTATVVWDDDEVCEENEIDRLFCAYDSEDDLKPSDPSDDDIFQYGIDHHTAKSLIGIPANDTGYDFTIVAVAD